MQKNWEKYSKIALLFVGTYGDRFFMFVHTLICNMRPELFSFICLTVIFVCSVELTSKH